MYLEPPGRSSEFHPSYPVFPPLSGQTPVENELNTYWYLKCNVSAITLCNSFLAPRRGQWNWNSDGNGCQTVSYLDQGTAPAEAEICIGTVLGIAGSPNKQENLRAEQPRNRGRLNMDITPTSVCDLGRLQQAGIPGWIVQG